MWLNFVVEEHCDLIEGFFSSFFYVFLMNSNSIIQIKYNEDFEGRTRRNERWKKKFSK